MKKIQMMILLVLFIFSLAACSQGEDEADQEDEERITSVEVAEVKEGDFTVERSLYGRITPNSTAPVMLEVPGEIDELEVKNGDSVEEDDLIAKISTPAGSQNIRAPKDGVVASLQGSEGDMATSEEPFVIVADMSPVKVEVSVTDKVRSLLEMDDTLTVTVDGQNYEATVTSVDTMPDDTGLYPVEVTLDDEEAEILPGVVAELLVPEKLMDDALIVPSEAIVNENDESFVYVVKDDIAGKKKVSVKETQSDETAIESEEVGAGDQIVITGQLTLSDGDQVNVAGGE